MIMFKKIMVVACLLSILPVRAMDGDDQDNGFFSKIGSVISNHPVATTLSIGALGLGCWAFKALHKLNKNEDIFRALCKGDVEKARQLIANGADINAYSMSNIGQRFLHVAVQQRRKDVIAHLLDLGANKKKCNVEGPCIPLELAITTFDPELVKELLCHVRLAGDKKVAPASRKRIMTALCIFNKTNLPKLPKDVQLEILAYLPEDVVSAEHCRLLLNKGSSLETLLNKCPIEWFKNIYDTSDAQAKVALLDAIVPLFTERKLAEIAGDISQVGMPYLHGMTNPAIDALLQSGQVDELYREEVECRVKKAFLAL